MTQAILKSPRASHLPSDGMLEVFKWLGLAAMTVDHVGALAFGAMKWEWTYNVGRSAFPLFALVLASRLAMRADRFGSLSWATPRRLLLWGLVSTPLYLAATGRWWPPAIFFTFALGAAVCRLEDLSLACGWKTLAHAAIGLLSLGCDYSVPGVYLVPPSTPSTASPAPGPSVRSHSAPQPWRS
jgi:hypothetical protein